MGRKIQSIRSFKRFLATLLVAVVIAAAFNPVTAQAKTKNITLKTVSNYDGAATAMQRASKVKTGITYKVKLKQYMALSYGGYLKFTAPKTKTYSFTVNNVKQPVKGANPMGSVKFNDPTSYGFMPLKVNTRGKSTEFLYVAAKQYKPGFGDAMNYYTSRTGKVKLYKGQTVYLYLMFDTMTYSNTMTVNVKIK